MADAHATTVGRPSAPDLTPVVLVRRGARLGAAVGIVFLGYSGRFSWNVSGLLVVALVAWRGP